MNTLEDKIRSTESALTTLAETEEASRIRVAWTGGKDSTVVLYIWKLILDHRSLGPVRAINLDTGCKFPEVLAFRDRLVTDWAVDLCIAQPDVELAGYPLAADVLNCCRQLKVSPLKKAIRTLRVTHLLTGIRRDEHPERSGRQIREERTAPAHTLVNPILDWTETDIWAFHAQFNLPHCELYDQGYRSLGCQPCTDKSGGKGGERGGRDQNKEESMKMLTSMGYF